MGVLIGFLVFGVATLAAYAWMRVEGRRNERESAGLREKHGAEVEFQRRGAAPGLADDLHPCLCCDAEFAFERALADVLGQAEYFLRYAVHEQGLLWLDDYAEQFPMPQRPEPPLAGPAEPWQLNLEAGADE